MQGKFCPAKCTLTPFISNSSMQTNWITLAVFTNLCRKNISPVLLLFRFLISEITGLLMCLFKFKIHINIRGRRKHVMHYQIPVLFMNKTNTRRVHTEIKWILHGRARRKVNDLWCAKICLIYLIWEISKLPLNYILNQQA